MQQTISHFRQEADLLCSISESIHTDGWQDSVGDAFYRDIIQPMKEESSKMSTTMEDLTSALYRIKEEIDKI